jgi:hypothetical protein
MMDPVTILAMVESLMKIALTLYETISKVQGDTAIPAWEEIVNVDNIRLQVKIDAEKSS